MPRFVYVCDVDNDNDNNDSAQQTEEKEEVTIMTEEEALATSNPNSRNTRVSQSRRRGDGWDYWRNPKYVNWCDDNDNDRYEVEYVVARKIRPIDLTSSRSNEMHNMNNTASTSTTVHEHHPMYFPPFADSLELTTVNTYPESMDDLITIPRPSLRTKSKWRTMMCYLCGFSFFWKILVLCLLWNRYAPPPPSGHMSWKQCMFSVGPPFLCSVVYNIRQDFLCLFQHSKSISSWLQMTVHKGRTSSWHSKVITSTCRLSCSSFTTVEYLMHDIVGQDWAVQTIADAMDTWKQENENQLEGGNTNNRTRPIVRSMLLMGSPGVGKSETARRVSNVFFHECLNDGENTGNNNHRLEGILELDAIEYYDNQYEHEHESDNDLMRTIVDHIQNQASIRTGRVEDTNIDTVIIIRHVDEFSMAQRTDLVLLLKQLSQSNDDTDDTWTYDINKNNDTDNNHSDSVNGRVISLVPAIISSKTHELTSFPKKNVLFLFTSSQLGMDTFVKYLEIYGDVDNIPYVDMQASIQRSVVGTFFDGYTPNLVVPFFPLQMGEITRIFRRMLRKISLSHEGIAWKRLDVLDSVISYFTGPTTIRYIQTTQSNTDVIFAERGIHDLVDNIFMRILTTQLNNGFFSKPDEIALCDYNGQSEEVIFSSCTAALYDNTLDVMTSCNEELRINTSSMQKSWYGHVY